MNFNHRTSSARRGLKSYHRRKAISLLELLVVFVILGVLASMLLPAINAARESARRMNCRNRLRQIGLALQVHEQTMGVLPPGFVQQPPVDEVSKLSVWPLMSVAPYFFLWDAPRPQAMNKPPESQVPGWGWAAHLLPYLDSKTLSDRVQWPKAVEDAVNQVPRETRMSVFTCPSDIGTGVYTVLDDSDEPIANAATNSYTASFGSYGLINEEPEVGNGLFQRNSRCSFKKVTDGLGKTIAIGERGAILTQSPWAGVMTGATCRTRVGAPVYTSTSQKAAAQVMARVGKRKLNSAFSEPYDFFSPHHDVVQFVFADGSVRSLTVDLDLNVLHAMATRNGDEQVDSSDL